MNNPAGVHFVGNQTISVRQTKLIRQVEYTAVNELDSQLDMATQWAVKTCLTGKRSKQQALSTCHYCHFAHKQPKTSVITVTHRYTYFRYRYLMTV